MKAPLHFERGVLSQMVVLVTVAREPEFPVYFSSLRSVKNPGKHSF